MHSAPTAARRRCGHDPALAPGPVALPAVDSEKADSAYSSPGTLAGPAPAAPGPPSPRAGLSAPVASTTSMLVTPEAPRTSTFGLPPESSPSRFAK